MKLAKIIHATYKKKAHTGGVLFDCNVYRLLNSQINHFSLHTDSIKCYASGEEIS